MEKRIKSFDDTEIYYIYHKNKNPHTLIFLHGVGGNWTVWKKEMEYFNKKGYSTLALDLRGHGLSGSPKKFDKYKLYNFTKDVHKIIKTEKINDFSLIAHSFGGGIAINYCMRYKINKPNSLVMIETSNTFPFDHNRILNHGPFLTHFLRFIARHKLTRKEHFFHFNDIDLSHIGIKENINIISQMLHLTPLRSVVKAMDNLETFVHKNHKKIDLTMKNFENPILLIAGGKDPIVPSKYAHIIKELNEKADYKELKDAGHFMIVDDAKKVNLAIYNFLSTKVKNQYAC